MRTDDGDYLTSPGIGGVDTRCGSCRLTNYAASATCTVPANVREDVDILRDFVYGQEDVVG